MTTALKDLKVLDLTWVVVGPTAIRTLADHGAQVVKVETSTRVDTARTAGPFLNSTPGPESSACFNNGNAGKLGLTLNLSTPAARDVIVRLIEWADVVAENFTPHVMRQWGLDYASVKAINPRIIYLSASMSGQDGPYSKLAAIGNVGAAIAGFTNVVGWPDRPPVGPGGAYTDYVASKYITLAILAALEFRERTGNGQHIDLAQSECAIHFLAPGYLDFQANGRLPGPVGNDYGGASPHGVFPCKGDDQWVAIAVQDEPQWVALTECIGRSDLAADPALRQFLQRLDRASEIEGAIAEWSSGRSAIDAESALIDRGVPAHAVLDSPMAVADDQLNHREHFLPVQHPIHGEIMLENARFRLGRTPGRVTRSGPTFGQDSSYILQDLLGFTDAELADLAAAGALD